MAIMEQTSQKKTKNAADKGRLQIKLFYKRISFRLAKFLDVLAIESRNTNYGQ